MKIAVMGTGGVGGYFGAKLAASGEQVHFIARGAHLQAMQEQGLQVYSPNGDVLVRPVHATSDPASVGTVDLVIVTVKLWSTEEALRDAKPLVGPATAVVSFQNGVVATDAIAQVYGRQRTLGGVANIAALIEKPGVIRHNGTMAILTIGELDGALSPRVHAFLNACTRANIQARAADNIVKAIWEKYVALVSMSAMTSLTRLPIGPIREDPDTRAVLRQLMSEVVAVGRAKGVRLDADTEERIAQNTERLPRDMVSSMLGDLERGNRLELPWLSGGVVQLGKELGVATPANGFIYAALKHYINGPPPDARTPKA
ncbi:MAG TPA: 2-dehydropantoate 2-reductase [Burkholderiales bacterium]|nr:2-dehydropantoate 2-reductase [Burkholderiales bacterium]